MTEADAVAMDTKTGATSTLEPRESSAPVEPVARPRYWIRVHGYPAEVTSETVYYNDFCDWILGPLPGDPKRQLHPGDMLIYYADGPGCLYAVASITGEPEGPFEDERRGSIWQVPIQREAIIRAVNKAPCAAWMQPPSGWDFLRAVRGFTFIRIADEDGPYFIEQVKARASNRD